MFGNRSERAERRAKRRAERRAERRAQRPIRWVPIEEVYSYTRPDDVEVPKSINLSDFLFPWELLDEPPSDGQPPSGPPLTVCPSCGRRYEPSSDGQPSSGTEPEGRAAAGAGAASAAVPAPVTGPAGEGS